jgi:hypothetical protein
MFREMPAVPFLCLMRDSILAWSENPESGWQQFHVITLPEPDRRAVPERKPVIHRIQGVC